MSKSNLTVLSSAIGGGVILSGGGGVFCWAATVTTRLKAPRKENARNRFIVLSQEGVWLFWRSRADGRKAGGGKIIFSQTRVRSKLFPVSECRQPVCHALLHSYSAKTLSCLARQRCGLLRRDQDGVSLPACGLRG